MTAELDGLKVAFLVAPEGFEQVEFTSPWEAVEKAGGDPALVSTSRGKAQAFRHLDRGDTFPVDAVVDDVTADNFDALVLPGGVANPDVLRTDPRAVAFTKSFFDQGKPVAVICHGPWTLVEAGVLSGRSITSWPSLATDIRNAGADWRDEEVVVDSAGPNTLISSRKPDDLPAFDAAVVRHFAAA
ncbi:type 1 glutamine amidotransferase [Yinghuangia sp. ASG 101]|uniref:type 1 glutamine amidotransferase domain-containing protein n=1 Tax=Yinghuangia sp. ASG 101 TaxID=2896848 RepID=UPI001E41D78F|nr:type 1 glutamine amidotransferase domain-containing protein [Yinghuangia sp. ASG 101]UGQ12937.1 type 1 glutamine amidotransferase [Yinghuangia sp. ASG 101]